MNVDINNLGSFSNIKAVWDKYPEGGKEGDYLMIGSTKYRWNKYDQIWENAPTVTQGTARSNEIIDGDLTVQNNLTVAGTLRAKEVKQPNCGLFKTLDTLKAKYHKPEVGMWAAVGNSTPADIYRCDTEGVWTATGEKGGVDMENFDTYAEGKIKEHAKNIYNEHVVQEAGVSTIDVMSQKTVTDMVNVPIESLFKIDGFIFTNGANYTDVNFHRTPYICIPKNVKAITFANGQVQENVYLNVCDADKKVTQQYSNNTEFRRIEFAETDRFIRISKQKGDIFFLNIEYKEAEYIPEVDEALFTNVGFVYKDGVIYGSKGFHYTDMIDISKYGRLKFYGGSNQANVYTTTYDGNKSVVRQFAESLDITDIELLPAEKWIRISKEDDLPFFMLFDKSVCVDNIEYHSIHKLSDTLFSNAGFYYTKGAYMNDGNFHCTDFINVSRLNSIQFYASENQKNIKLITYDKDYNYVAEYTNSVYLQEVEFSDNEKYIKISKRVGTNFYCNIPLTREEKTDVYTDFRLVNQFVYINGELYGSPNFVATDFVDVQRYSSIEFYSNEFQKNLYLATYDKNKKFVRQFNNSQKKRHVELLPNECYIRFSKLVGKEFHIKFNSCFEQIPWSVYEYNKGYFIDSRNGDMLGNSSFNASTWIDLEDYESVVYCCKDTQKLAGIAFYDYLCAYQCGGINDGNYYKVDTSKVRYARLSYEKGKDTVPVLYGIRKKKEVSAYITINSFDKHTGKIWCAIGDSFTAINGGEGNGNGVIEGRDTQRLGFLTEGYMTQVIKQMPYLKLNNCGYSGQQSFWPVHYLDIPEADIYTIMFGTNDFADSRTVLKQGTTTFKTGLDGGTTEYFDYLANIAKTIRKIRLVKENAKIIVMFPSYTITTANRQSWTPYSGNYGVTHANGYTFEDMCNSLKACCEAHNIPFVDVMHDSGITPYNAVNGGYVSVDGVKTKVDFPDFIKYLTLGTKMEWSLYENDCSWTTYDGCHPSNLGMKLIADLLVPKLREVLYEQ